MHFIRDNADPASIADTAPVLIWISGTNSVCTYFNQTWLNFTGRSLQEELRSGWLTGLHPDDAKSCLEGYAQSFARREKFRREYRLRRYDGQYRWIIDIGIPRFGEDHSFEGYVGIAVDITEKKSAEEALRLSEERLRLAQQVAHIGTFDRNVRTGQVTCSAELEALYGLPPGSFEGTTIDYFMSLIHRDDRATVAYLVDRALRTGEPMQGEWRVVWPDKSIHWIAGHWQVLMDESDEPLRMVGVNIDVTDRRLAEEKLREYERAVEGSDDMIVVVDREYHYLIANRQYLKMWNTTRERVLGHFVYELVDPQIFESTIKPKLDECFQGKVVRYETKCVYPELGERELFISYYPIEGPNRTDRVACILQDTTDRKRAEEAIAGLSRKLIEAQEQERSRIGRELHDDITQRLAMLSLELGQLQDSSSDPASRVQQIRKRLIDISEDVQALSHELHSSKLEYLGAVAGIKSWCREFADRQKVQIDFRNDTSSALSSEVGLSIFRVLQAALHNAIKHGGAKRVEVQFREESGEVHLTVHDGGRGFDVDSAMRGNGSGLISMRERIRLLNGSITIDSKPGTGTTIHVRVPIGSQQAGQRLTA